MGELFKTPAIIAAIITSSIAALGILIQAIIAFTRKNIKVQANFENSLKEKLEKIYSPLLMELSKSNDNINFVNEDVITLINKYGYLLSSELLFSLRELYKIETERTEGNVNYIEEYKNLRAKIEKQANREFTHLQSMYNGNFDTYESILLRTWFEKLYVSAKNPLLFLTGVFWLAFVSIYLLSKINPVNIFIDNPTGDSIATVLILVVVLTTFVVVITAITRTFLGLCKLINKKKKIYMPYEYAPQTGIYKCKICNEVKKFYKNEQFKCCESKKNLNVLKGIVYIYIWSLCTDLSDSKREDKFGIN